MHSRNLFKIFFYIILIFTICPYMSYANSPSLNPQDLDQALALTGIAYKQAGQNLEVTIEKNRALNAIPAMQQAGTVNPALTLTDINLLPVSLAASVVGMQFTTWIINYIYKTNTSIDNLHVQVYLSSADENNTKQLCYSFDFNRSMYDKINWRNFTSVNLANDSSNFTISDWCMNKETAELRFTGMDKPQSEAAIKKENAA